MLRYRLRENEKGMVFDSPNQRSEVDLVTVTLLPKCAFDASGMEEFRSVSHLTPSS